MVRHLCHGCRYYFCCRLHRPMPCSFRAFNVFVVGSVVPYFHLGFHHSTIRAQTTNNAHLLINPSKSLFVFVPMPRIRSSNKTKRRSQKHLITIFHETHISFRLTLACASALYAALWRSHSLTESVIISSIFEGFFLFSLSAIHSIYFDWWLSWYCLCSIALEFISNASSWTAYEMNCWGESNSWTTHRNECNERERERETNTEIEIAAERRGHCADQHKNISIFFFFIAQMLCDAACNTIYTHILVLNRKMLVH